METGDLDPILFLKEKCVPRKSSAPSVIYVSLSEDAKNRFADSTGHRFLVLQCNGYVRILQACQSESRQNRIES